MCKDIKDRLAFPDGPEVIGKFPSGLDSIYERILDKLNRLSEMHRKFCRLILNWLVCSSRPLRFAELEHALKLSQSSSTDYFEKVEGGKYQLCFSRKDIVRVCGSLVSCTGLEDGDTIGLIHLTARDFLSRASGTGEVPVHLSSFGVNVPNSKARLCSTCLDVLLDRSLHADPYFQGREDLLHQPKARDSAFRERHPLLEYSVRYWPELAWDALTSQPENDNIVNLTDKITAFAESEFSVFWTESFVSQYGLEFCILIVKRFRRLSSLLSKALPWVNSVLSTLETYSLRILHNPRAILSSMNTQSLARREVNEARKTQALVQVGLPAQSPRHQSDLPIPLTGWAHYDLCTDSLYHVPDRPRRKELDRWIIGEEVKLRPAVHTADLSSFVEFDSATVSLCNHYIAVTYLFEHRCIQTVLWKINPQSEHTAAANWAEFCLVDQHEISAVEDIFYTSRYTTSHKPHVVSFGKKNTLSAPGGIWNIVSREKVSRPTAIYEPEASLAVSYTCFGMDRVARVLHNSELEILDMDGISLLRHELDVHERSIEIQTVKFSSSSRKLAVHYISRGLYPIIDEGLYCFLLDKKVLVKLQVSNRNGLFFESPKFESPNVQFANDENKIIAGFRDTSGTTSFLVYALPNSIGSSSYEELPGTCIFRTTYTNMALCIQPAVTADTPSLFLHTQNDGLQKRALDQEWTEMEDRHLRDVAASETTRYETDWYPIKQATQWVSIHSPYINGPGTVHPADESLLTVRTWRCGYQLELEGTVIIELQSLNSLPDMSWAGMVGVSCNGKYITTRQGLFQLNHDSLTLVNFRLAGKITIDHIDFSQDETRVAVTYSDRMSFKHHLSVFELLPDLTTRLLAKEPCQGKPLSVAFHPINFSFLIISSEKGLRILKICDAQPEMMEVWSRSFGHWILQSRFSSCGNYVTVASDDVGFNRGNHWPKFKAPYDAVDEQARANHPNMFVEREICSPDMYRLHVEFSSGIVYLEHKLLDSADDEYRIRILCLLPGGGFLGPSPMLIWPPDDADDDEVKFTWLSQNWIVRTGIRSCNLLHGDEWIAAKDLKKK